MLIFCQDLLRIQFIRGKCIKRSSSLLKEKAFADNLLTPMSSEMSVSFFLQSKRN